MTETKLTEEEKERLIKEASTKLDELQQFLIHLNMRIKDNFEWTLLFDRANVHIEDLHQGLDSMLFT